MKIKNIEMEYTLWKYPTAVPYSWMVNDLYRGVQAEQNYLVALGLFSYSEFIGRTILGAVGKRGGGCKAFRIFTENFVGYHFTSNEEWEMVFDRYRNGLSHEFYIKSNGSGVYNDDGTTPCGITISGPSLELKIHSYFKHFVKGLEKSIDEGILKNY